MTLKEANYEVEKLTNDLNKLLRDKELLETIVSPKAIDTSKISVDGGKHVNVLDIYVEKQDIERWRDLDKKIQHKQNEIKNNMNWIENELKILKKYDKVEQQIVYYKEICPQKYTWHQISDKVYYSIPQCKRIYSRYKATRNIH